MFSKSTVLVPLAALTLVSGLTVGSAQAQEGGQQRQRQRGERPERQAGGEQGQRRGGEQGERRGGGDFRQRMAERLKGQLEASDEEWAVLQPRIEKVQQLQMQSRFGGMMGGRGGPGGPGRGPGGPEGQRGPGGPGGPQANAPQSEVAKAGAELRTALQDKETSADVIKAKLQALRDARAKSREQLGKAQEELREVISLRQEAVLVTAGLLD